MVRLCPFRQRGIWTSDNVDSATAWTFSVEMSGSSCSASGATGPDHYSVFLLFHVPFEENHQITANPENVDLRLPIRPPPRLGGLAVACSLLVDPGRRLCTIFLTSHSSATRHQWLNLFSTRHECFTSDVGLTRTRLVSCILLTSLVSTSWLNALPIVEHGFDLSKAVFRDAVSLRHGWEIKNRHSTCACKRILTLRTAGSCVSIMLQVSHERVAGCGVENPCKRSMR